MTAPVGALLVACIGAGPLMAQDAYSFDDEAAQAMRFIPQMNPAAIGGGLVMPSAINAQAKRHASRTSNDDESAEEVCRDLPNRRARLGAADPLIRKLTTLCRQANLPSGG